MDVANRIRIWRETLEQTQSQFSEQTGIPLRTLKGYEAGERQPGTDALISIARTGVSATWLLTGKGPVRAEIEKDQFSAFISVRKRQSPTFQAIEAPSIQEQLAELAEVLQVIPRLYADRLINEFILRAHDARHMDHISKTLAELQATLQR